MPFRDTYWNIPQWAKLLLFIVQFLGVAILLGRLYRRVQLWLNGRTETKIDHVGLRLWRVIKYAFLQMRIARERYRAIMHFSIFAAMIFLFIGTALATIDHDIADLIFDVKLLKGDFYLLYELTLDFFTVAAIAGLGMALLRRVTPRPARLTYHASFTFMLWFLFLIVLSGLTLESFRLAAVQPEWQTWSFAGFAVSKIWPAIGLSDEALRTAHLVNWVFHFSLAGLTYAISLDLPLKHIIYAPLNVFFSSFKPAGQLATLNLDDEDAESFGVSQIHELSTWQLMDADACTECGMCQDACPAYMAGTPLNPKQIILDCREALSHYASAIYEADTAPMPVVRDFVSTGALWACTTCRACVYECPVLIEHVDTIVDMRRSLVLMDGEVPDLLATAMTQAERAGDPWGNSRGTRMDWAHGLDVPLFSEKQSADVLYWVGCAGSYDPDSQQTARAMVRIFEAAGIDYAVLGEEERCNCEWARRAGNEFLFQEATYSNIAVFDQYEFQTIVTHCPHCFNTFANEYPDFGGHYDVVHHSTYIARLIKQGHLKITSVAGEKATYHDSCYLGRYNQIYDAPRAILDASGLERLEMPRHKGEGLCCGGGGAQVWFETHQETPVNEIRLAEALSTGASTVVSACPFCTLMLSSAAQSKGETENLQIRDIAILVASALGK
nr:4Fe-4S dicluster domain-containing protein [Anaerolineae bacterium]